MNVSDVALEQEDEGDDVDREDGLTESPEDDRDLISPSIPSDIDPSPLPSLYKLSEEEELAWESGSEYGDSLGRTFTLMHPTGSESCGSSSGCGSIDEAEQRVGLTCASEGGDRF